MKLKQTLRVLLVALFVFLCLIIWQQVSRLEGETQKHAAVQIRPQTDSYLQKAERGDVAAQYNLSIMYSLGRGVEKDWREAVKWCRKAAEQGHIAAQYRLGSIYLVGKLVEKDEVEAVKWYHKAAEQGYAKAQCELGRCYASGRGVTRDDIEAEKWFYKAAEQGCFEAKVGILYRKKAEQGDVVAQYELGLCYADGRGVEKDAVEAAKWYRRAAEQGLAKAQYELGLCYVRGKGVVKDLAEAEKWCRKAAEQGYVIAQKVLRDVEKKYLQEQLRTAAEQGDVDAQYILGLCYLIGEGVVEDKFSAIRWFREAAKQGHGDAQEILKDAEKDQSVLLGKVVSGGGENGQGDTDRGRHSRLRHSRLIGAAAYASKSGRAFSQRGKVGKAAGAAGVVAGIAIIGNEILNYNKEEEIAERFREVREGIKHYEGINLYERIEIRAKIERFLRERFGTEIHDRTSLNHSIPTTIDNK